ncbi:MAG: AAA family ATPase [Myxococcales bacterium]|nr:AAA family ATPase [Myxococcales bacterium]
MSSRSQDTQLSLRSVSEPNDAERDTWDAEEPRSLRDDPAFIEFCSNRRFSIRRRLGAGGMGVVYEALDHEREEVVALKTLLGVSPSALYRFKREFRALADVTHPNLISLHALFSEGERMFFTMEYIDGVDFVEWVRAPLSSGAPGGRAALLERLRSGLRQLAGAIGAIHAAGVLHRDLKPSNVLVNAQGRAVVLDFGLVSESVVETMRSGSGDMVGTPAYISPEQAGGAPASEASDWYALGVMTYLCLTGRLPFRGKGLAMLLAKQERDPTPPSVALAREREELGEPVTDEDAVPEDLEALCLTLLRRDPRARPRALEILERLGVDEDGPSGSGLSRSGRRELLWREALFIGREAHLRALREAYDATHRGNAVAVHVYGRSGMGKTALVQRFLADLRAREEGAVILVGRCYERESVSFKALDSLVDSLCQHLVRLPERRVAELMPRDILALARVFPVLQRVGAVAQSPRRATAIPDPRELRRRAFAALKELLARMADRRPLVLHIDDLQWGDRDSAALLADLLSPPDAPALLLIASYRSEYSTSAPVLRALRDRSSAEIDTRGIEVGPMSVREACDLALALLKSSEPRGGVSPRARARQIARESQGSPLFVHELARYVDLVAEPPDDGAARGKPRAGELLLDQVLTARLAQLPEDARVLLEIIAVSGGPLDERLATVAAALKGDARGTLALLRGEHLVLTHSSEDGSTVESYHDRIREFVLSRLDSERLRARHRALAFAMEAAGDAGSDTLAVHFREAGEWERAGEYARTAADQAAAALAFDRAARLYRLALEFIPRSDPGLSDLQCRLADALANGGRGGRAARIYLEAADRAGPGQRARALDLRRRAAEQLLQAGHYAEGLRTLRDVVDEAGLSYPQGRRRALTMVAFERVRLRLRGLSLKLRPDVQVNPRDRAQLDVCRSAAAGLAAHDPQAAALFHARHLSMALKTGHAFHAACALAVELAFVALPGERARERTERLVTAAQSLTQRVEAPFPRGLLALTRGVAGFMMGRWRDALGLFERAEELLRTECVGAGYEITLAQTFRMLALTHMGLLHTLDLEMARCISAANERDNLWADTTLRAGPQNIRWLAADEPEQARAELIRVGKRWPEGGFAMQRLWTFIAKVQLDLYLGDGAEAWSRLAGRWSTLAQGFMFECQWLRITLLHLRISAALLRITTDGSARERAGLVRSIEADIRTLTRERALWVRPIVELARAGLGAVEGGPHEARAHLRAAEQGFKTVDMALHAAAARWRFGQLVGGDEGRELIESALAFTEDQGIKQPARMLAMFTPGFPEAG